MIIQKIINNQNFLKKSNVLAMLILLAGMGVFTNLYGVNEPGPTVVTIQLGNETFTLKEGYVGIEKSGDDYKLIYSITDRDHRVKMMITAVLPQGPETEQKLESFHHDVVLTYRSVDGTMMIMPEYRLVKGGGPPGHSRRPPWAGKTREERIKRGEGVVRNSAFAGTFFTVRYKPVQKDNGKTIAAELHFNGQGKYYPRSLARPTGQLTQIHADPLVLPVFRGDLRNAN